tara:strand:+ start:519 stop:899 length:381 start_codon:yes stop_codon:yes gene_type:complete
MANLRAQYIDRLGRYAQKLEALWTAAADDQSNLSNIQSMAHRLAGSGKAYGFRELSQVARELEQALEQTEQFSRQERASAASEPFSALLRALRQILKDESNEVGHNYAQNAAVTKSQSVGDCSCPR